MLIMGRLFTIDWYKVLSSAIWMRSKTSQMYVSFLNPKHDSRRNFPMCEFYRWRAIESLVNIIS